MLTPNKWGAGFRRRSTNELVEAMQVNADSSNSTQIAEWIQDGLVDGTRDWAIPELTWVVKAANRVEGGQAEFWTFGPAEFMVNFKGKAEWPDELIAPVLARNARFEIIGSATKVPE